MVGRINFNQACGRIIAVMNLPNKITVFRIILVPFFVFFLLYPGISNNYLIALAIFIFSSVTDLLDGHIARKRGLITEFGKLCDPLADKILVMSAFSCFVQLNIISAIVLIIVIMREFVVTSIRFMALSKGKVVAANSWGKLKTVSQMFAIIVLLFAKTNFFEVDSIIYVALDNLGSFLIVLSTIFTIISGCLYVIQNRKFIRQ